METCRLHATHRLQKIGATLQIAKHFTNYCANPNKCNLVRLILWHAKRENVPIEEISWIAPYIKSANISNWDDRDIYSEGRTLLRRLLHRDDDCSDFDELQSESADSESDSGNTGDSDSDDGDEAGLEAFAWRMRGQGPAANATSGVDSGTDVESGDDDAGPFSAGPSLESKRCRVVDGRMARGLAGRATSCPDRVGGAWHRGAAAAGRSVGPLPIDPTA